jgi:hypothetical protein
VRHHGCVTPRRKALLLYLAVIVTAPIVVLTALGGLLASGETLEWEVEWADWMQAIAFFAVTAWAVLVAVAFRFGVESARRIRNGATPQFRGRGR